MNYFLRVSHFHEDRFASYWAEESLKFKVVDRSTVLIFNPNAVQLKKLEGWCRVTRATLSPNYGIDVA